MSNTQLVWSGIKQCLQIVPKEFNDLKTCIEFHRNRGLFTIDGLLYGKFNYNKMMEFSVGGSEVYRRDNVVVYSPIKWCALDRLKDVPSTLGKEITNPKDLPITVVLNERHQIKGDTHVFDVNSISDDSLAILVYCNCTGNCKNGKFYEEKNTIKFSMSVDRDELIVYLLNERLNRTP